MSLLPHSASVFVAEDLAHELYAAAGGLPAYKNHEFYDQQLQQNVYEHIARSGTIEWLRSELLQRLCRPPYCAVVKGLQFDDRHRVLVALNRMFGTLIARPYNPAMPRACLIQHVQPTTDLNAASGRHKLSERLHTDGADQPVPFRYLSMQCLQPDAGGGGRSLLLDLDALRDEIVDKAGSDLLLCLQANAVPWRLGDYLGSGVTWAPVLDEHRLRWRRYTIDEALSDPGVTLSGHVRAALDKLDEIVANSDRVMEFSLQAQDYVIMDNWRCLHARTPISASGASRLMLRAWIEP